MWTMLFLLWLIPITLGVVVFARIMDGRAALNDYERQLFFDERRKTELGFWLLVKFALLAVAFFAAGLFQGVVLPNLSGFWLVTVPLLTGSTAILLLVLWLRSPSSRSRRLRGGGARMQTRFARLAESLFR
jgi:hypothetical protein